MNVFNASDVSEQYLTNTCDNFQKELYRLMSATSGENVDLGKERERQKEITLLNSILLQILKFKKFRKALSLKN